MPATINLLNISGVRSIILRIRENKITYKQTMILIPKKPNFSAIIAKIESLAASGKYPKACTPCPSPFPNTPPEPTVTKAWQA